MCAKYRPPIRTDTSQSSCLRRGGGPSRPSAPPGNSTETAWQSHGKDRPVGETTGRRNARTFWKISASSGFFSAKIWIKGELMPCRRSPQNDAGLAGKVPPLSPSPVRFKPSVCERIWHPSRKIEGAPLDLYYRQETASWVLSLDSRDRRFGPASWVKRISNPRPTGHAVDE